MNTNSNISQKLFETVERYYNSSLTQLEHDTFEKKLNQNADLRSQVEAIKSLFLGIEEQSLKEQLEVFHSELKQNEDLQRPAITNRFSFQKMAVAASLFITLGLIWFFTRTTPEKLYSEFFRPDPGLPTTMSSDNNYPFFEAMVDYKLGDYQSAIKQWKALETKSTDNDTLTYFLGVANMADGNIEESIRYLEKSTHFDKSVFKNDAYHFLGLAYLKNCQEKKAINNLKLSTHENSQKLLDELN